MKSYARQVKKIIKPNMVTIILPLDALKYYTYFYPQTPKSCNKEKKDIMIRDVGWHLGNCHSIKIKLQGKL